MSDFIIEGRSLTRAYRSGGGLFTPKREVMALKGVSFAVPRGKTLAIVGESGCGKSTLARIMTLIDPATSGELLIDGQAIDIRKSLPPEVRRKVQIVFQNPYGSLNPRQTVGGALEEPLKINTDMSAADRAAAVVSMRKRVGFRPEHATR